MAIMRWDPFGEITRMQRDMDRIFSRMGIAQGTDMPSEMGWMPKIDVKKQGDDLMVRAELPGMKREDVNVEVADGMLTISGERKMEQEREDEGWLVRESSYGSFQRSIALPEGVDPGAVKADYRDGVLEITVPRALQESQPQSHRVEIGGGQGEAQGGESKRELPDPGLSEDATPERVHAGVIS